VTQILKGVVWVVGWWWDGGGGAEEADRTKRPKKRKFKEDEREIEYMKERD
jgi:hypothetical protein